VDQPARGVPGSDRPDVMIAPRASEPAERDRTSRSAGISPAPLLQSAQTGPPVYAVTSPSR
ncbi:hypothetical protein NUK32_21630, partial [Aeromonas caviae]|nr:hypothetical protein [Aeromonas caviae]